MRNISKRIVMLVLTAMLLTVLISLFVFAANNSEPDDSLAARQVASESSGKAMKSEGSSFYTVEFTYNNKQYVLPGDSQVPLLKILDMVGLTGEVSEVEVSNDSLFSAMRCRASDNGEALEMNENVEAIEDENGSWFVFAPQAFTSKEWMKVTIGGVVYEIIVTDAAAITQNTAVVINNSNKSPYGGKSITGTVPADSYT